MQLLFLLFAVGAVVATPIAEEIPSFEGYEITNQRRTRLLIPHNRHEP